MLALYWLGVKAYELAIRLAALWNEKAAEAVRGRQGLMKIIEAAMRLETRPRVWMHCASLGEFEQGRPVLEALRKKYPERAFVLTFFSPSGYRVRKDWEGADYVFYLPFDGAGRARTLVRLLRPSLAVWVKYEFWYFTLLALKQSAVPTILIAAVFEKKAPAFRWWGALHRRMARGFSWIFTQDEASRGRLLTTGIVHASTAGDPRYDRVLEAVASSQKHEKAAQFAASGYTIVAGSTWPADEAVLAEALQKLPPEVRLLLVPHEVDNGHLQAIEVRFGKAGMRWSRWEGERMPRVLIVDAIGLLMDLYHYADAAYVGGGFGRAGVHNVLEPAAHGVPVIVGPEYDAYQEAVGLVERGGGIVIQNAERLTKEIRFLQDAANRRSMGLRAAQVVQGGAGATARIITRVQQLLEKDKM